MTGILVVMAIGLLFEVIFKMFLVIITIYQLSILPVGQVVIYLTAIGGILWVVRTIINSTFKMNEKGGI